MYWKTFFKKRIYHTKKPAINVYENWFFRWLEFDSQAIQTLINKRKPGNLSLKYIAKLIWAVQQEPGDCCMLGLGGGGAAHALNSLLFPFKFTIVEKSNEVIEIAQRFFMLDQIKATIIHDDALHFLGQNQEKFKHLLVDLFSAKTFPRECKSIEFFKACKAHLASDGIMAVNIANQNEQWAIFQLMQKVFSKATLCLPVNESSNFIVFATNEDGFVNFINKIKTSLQLKSLSWDSKWGHVAELDK